MWSLGGWGWNCGSVGRGRGGVAQVLHVFVVLLAYVLVTLFFKVVVLIDSVRKATHMIGCTKLIHKGARRVVGLRGTREPRSRVVERISTCVSKLHRNDSGLGLIHLSSGTFRSGVRIRRRFFRRLGRRVCGTQRRKCRGARVVGGDRAFFAVYSRAAKLTRDCSRGLTSSLGHLRGVIIISVVKVIYLLKCRLFGTLQCTTRGHILHRGICLSRTAKLPGGGGYRRVLTSRRPLANDRSATMVIFSLGGLEVVGSQRKRRENSRCVESFTRRLQTTLPRGCFIKESNKSRFVTILGRISRRRIGSYLRVVQRRARHCSGGRPSVPLDCTIKCTLSASFPKDGVGSLFQCTSGGVCMSGGQTGVGRTTSGQELEDQLLRSMGRGKFRFASYLCYSTVISRCIILHTDSRFFLTSSNDCSNTMRRAVRRLARRRGHERL